MGLTLASLVLCLSPAALASGDYVSDEAAPDRFPVVHGKLAADVFVAENDWTVARIAARDLTRDIGRVTGLTPSLTHDTAKLPREAVLVGTLGRSSPIDALVKTGRLDVGELRGKWESFVIQVVPDPLPGVSRGLVVVGSDRRGTAYGVYELSRRIGVSPWYWWADVTPKRRGALHVSTERVEIGPPAVKYRGIFINDEMWGIRPWAQGTLAPDEGKGLGPTTHAKIFELLLRLRANYLWPAMHRGTIPFNYYPKNREVADDYAIVMGSSHIEPMLRNNMHEAEWDREETGEWNYLTNRDVIYRYWERRIESNGRYENVYTIGMRGKDDEAMYGKHSEKDKISLLERIFQDQRQILRKHVDPDPTKVPQVFIPYTEVLDLYDAGMKVPEDVMICWPDDNFGYIRRLPTPAEQARPGGSGVYYHLQWLNGATTAYTWLNTMPLPLIYTEMSKAWQYQARDLWVLNVGDIKPGELGMEFFLTMAWHPERFHRDGLREYLTGWAERDLDPRFAKEVAEIMEEHFQLGFTRRPEHLVQWRKDQPLQYSWFSHEHYNDEASRRLQRYADISKRAEDLYARIADRRKDAFFQLVLYPVKCAALMNEKVICADRSMRHAAHGRATAREYAQRARAAAESIIEITEHYNTGLITVGDKWRHMMSWAPGPWGNQRHQFEMPPLSDFEGLGPPTLDLAPEGGRSGEVADLSIYTQGRRFIDLFNTGKGELRWKAIPSEPWLKLDQSEGSFTTGQRVWVSVDWDKAPTGSDIKPVIRFETNGSEGKVAVPIFSPAEPARDEVTGFVESHGCVSMEAEHFTRRHKRGGAEWEVVPRLGRCGDAVTIVPATVASHTDPDEIRQHSPSLEYDMHLFRTGAFDLHIDCLPTRPVAPDRGVRLAVSIDDGELILLDEKSHRPSSSVLTNLRRWEAKVPIAKPGRHTLTVWMIDPGVIIDRIVLHTEAPKESYLGPPESYRR